MAKSKDKGKKETKKPKKQKPADVAPDVADEQN
jgi:hypothetical protein